MDSPAGAAACLVTHSEKTVARALAVPDVVEAEKELRRFEIDYWTLKDVAAPNLQQLFFRDLERLFDNFLTFRGPYLGSVATYYCDAQEREKHINMLFFHYLLACEAPLLYFRYSSQSFFLNTGSCSLIAASRN